MWIGGLCISVPVFLAPMAGITDRVFRRLVREFGCGLLYTEMIASQSLVRGSRRSLDAARISPSERPVAVQLLGADPEIMADSADIALDLGASVVDINMGCPVPKVIKKGEGAALMLDFARAREIAGAVVRRVSSSKAGGIPVTAKIRKGWEHTGDIAPALSEILEGEGVSAIAVHGRFREQAYSGPADWGTIEQVKKRINIPVIGNGSISVPQDAKRMMEETGCDAVMVGRAVQGRPWFLAQAITCLGVTTNCEGGPLWEPSLSERMDVAVRHLDMLVAELGERAACLKMRSHGAWYLKGFPNAAELRKRVQQAATRVQF